MARGGLLFDADATDRDEHKDQNERSGDCRADDDRFARFVWRYAVPNQEKNKAEECEWGYANNPLVDGPWREFTESVTRAKAQCHQSDCSTRYQHEKDEAANSIIDSVNTSHLLWANDSDGPNQDENKNTISQN